MGIRPGRQYLYSLEGTKVGLMTAGQSETSLEYDAPFSLLITLHCRPYTVSTLPYQNFRTLATIPPTSRQVYECVCTCERQTDRETELERETETQTEKEKEKARGKERLP